MTIYRIYKIRVFKNTNHCILLINSILFETREFCENTGQWLFLRFRGQKSTTRYFNLFSLKTKKYHSIYTFIQIKNGFQN